MNSSNQLVTIDNLIEDPYQKVLCYPQKNFNLALNRIRELKFLQIKGIIFEGKTKINNLQVLGKGCVSVVVKVLTEFGINALKIRRMDANRPSMFKETEMHLIANSVGIGPIFFDKTENFILMEFIEGECIFEWLKTIEKKTIEKIRYMIKDILDQCYILDKIGLDHGELSNLKKHIIISTKPVMIDFESASINRRVANVSKVIQYLFVGGFISNSLRNILSIKNLETIFDSIKNYKTKMNEQSYLKLLKDLHLIGNHNL